MPTSSIRAGFSPDSPNTSKRKDYLAEVQSLKDISSMLRMQIDLTRMELEKTATSENVEQRALVRCRMGEIGNLMQVINGLHIIPYEMQKEMIEEVRLSILALQNDPNEMGKHAKFLDSEVEAVRLQDAVGIEDRFKEILRRGE